MARGISRRSFLATTIPGTLAATWFVGSSQAAQSRSANEKLNLAFAGVGHKGWDNVEQLSSQNVFALCDVDSKLMGKAAEKHPRAKQFRDYRKLLETERPRLDGFVVSTADHTHAPATSLALSMDLPVYCEKPLTHTVQEARAIARLAAKHKVATQMGSQPHSYPNYAKVVATVQSGVLGKVEQVHAWCNKGWSDGRFDKPETTVPEHLDWDLWLGPASERPYYGNIHPANWRRFWEFGSGTFGDMACHIMGLPFMALNLRHPETISCTGPEVHPHGAPSWTKCEFQFGPRGEMPPLKLYWSDGNAHYDLVSKTVDSTGKQLSSWGAGVLFVGEKGMLAANYSKLEFIDKAKFEGFEPPKGRETVGHCLEWVDAIKTGSPTICNFEYSAALTETILLGIVSYRSGQRLEWDGSAGKLKNSPLAAPFLTKTYRKGFEVVGLE